MPLLTATQVMTAAFADLNVYLNGETVQSADSSDFLTRLNWFVEELANQSLTIPAVARYVFTLLPNVGSSTNPYTIGSGGNLTLVGSGATVPRPTFQDSITHAGLLLNASNPPIEIPRGIYTHDMYEQERIKDLTSTLFTAVYYNPTFGSDQGQILLWPVPTDLTNNLVLYVEQPLATFPDLTTQLSVPPGFGSMLQWNLAEQLAVPYGREVPPTVTKMAVKSLGLIKRSGVKLFDLPNEFAAIGGQTRKSWYNIQTGEGSY